MSLCVLFVADYPPHLPTVLNRATLDLQPMGHNKQRKEPRWSEMRRSWPQLQRKLLPLWFRPHWPSCEQRTQTLSTWRRYLCSYFSILGFSNFGSVMSFICYYLLFSHWWLGRLSLVAFGCTIPGGSIMLVHKTISQSHINKIICFRCLKADEGKFKVLFKKRWHNFKFSVQNQGDGVMDLHMVPERQEHQPVTHSSNFTSLKRLAL